MRGSFLFNDTATTEIYTLSLHDALPICATLLPTLLGVLTGPLAARALGPAGRGQAAAVGAVGLFLPVALSLGMPVAIRSEEHTSELQSRQYLVCRLLLEKKRDQRPSQIG